MPKVQTISTNFTAGEQSPRLRGRPDLEKYNASASELFNVVVLKQGGATIRPPTKFIGPIKDHAQTARIIPFVYSRTDAYLLELGDQYMRVWRDGEAVETSPGTPYEVTTPWSDERIGAVDYSQGADTMLAAHPDVPTQSVQRFADTRWVVQDAAWDPPPTAEIGDRSAASMTISNVAVGSGRTLTAGSSFFLAADVGRVMTWGGGRATITAVASGTSATADVTVAFATSSANGLGGASPVWNLDGQPQTTLTPGGASPVGASTAMTLTVDGWHSDVVGGIIEVNGGVLQIASITSATVVQAIILKELSGTTAAIKDTWTLRKPIFNATDGYPAAVTFFQQRTWLANTYRFPQTQFGSRSGLYFDFTPGVDDGSAVFKTVDSDEINPIQYLLSDRTLIALTLGGEFETRGGVEKPVTPTNASVSRQTRWGCNQVRPEQAGDDVLFVQRGGKVLRAIRRGDLDGFTASDVSVFSEHLLRQRLTSMAFEQTPESVMWASTGDGKLLAITYNPEQDTIAFCSGEVSGGFVEWVATVPEGDADATYLLVRRTIDGSTVRYIEKLDWGDWTTTQEIRNAHDCYVEVESSSRATWSGFGHLEGETVSVLADEIYMGEFVVTGGEFTLPREATKVSVGLPYVARIRQEAPEVGTGSGTSQGQAISVHRTAVRLYKTIGLKINGEPVHFRAFDVPNTLDQPVEPFSGIKELSNIGWAKGEAPLVLEQDQPYPWTVLAIIRGFTVNSG